MNKKLLFCLFLSIFSSTFPFSWFEHPLISYVREFLLKKMRGNNLAINYYQQNIKKESTATTKSQITEDPKETFRKALYGKIVDGNNKWGLVEDFYEYNRTKKARMHLPDHKVIQKQMADESSQIYDLIEKYQWWLEIDNWILSRYEDTDKITKKINAVEAMNNFKKTANFHQLSDALASIKFAKCQPWDFDKKLAHLMRFMESYLAYEISHYYMPFYQFDQFLN